MGNGFVRMAHTIDPFMIYLPHPSISSSVNIIESLFLLWRRRRQHHHHHHNHRRTVRLQTWMLRFIPSDSRLKTYPHKESPAALMLVVTNINRYMGHFFQRIYIYILNKRNLFYHTKLWGVEPLCVEDT